jgi:hypothetical protein
MIYGNDQRPSRRHNLVHYVGVMEEVWVGINAMFGNYKGHSFLMVPSPPVGTESYSWCFYLSFVFSISVVYDMGIPGME